MEKKLEDNLSEDEKEVFNKILPLKLHLDKYPLSYDSALNYDANCNTCKQCPGCGCMCNND